MGTARVASARGTGVFSNRSLFFTILLAFPSKKYNIFYHLSSDLSREKYFKGFKNKLKARCHAAFIGEQKTRSFAAFIEERKARSFAAFIEERKARSFAAYMGECENEVF